MKSYVDRVLDDAFSREGLDANTRSEVKKVTKGAIIAAVGGDRGHKMLRGRNLFADIHVAQGLNCPHCERQIRPNDVSTTHVALDVIIVCPNCHHDIMRVVPFDTSPL
jgi:hypothetical protein